MDDLQAVGTAGQPGLQLVQHGGRAIHGDHSPVGQAVEQGGGVTAGPAADVEDRLAAGQRQAGEGAQTPLLVGQWQGIVATGVPFVRHVPILRCDG